MPPELTVEFRILGTLQVANTAGLVEFPARKLRALLTVLIVHANQVVSADRLIDSLWGQHPPATAANTLQGYISQLRRALEKLSSTPSESPHIHTQAPGYVLFVDPERIDARRFERLLRDGRTALVASDARRAARLLDEGLSLWRGPALADFAGEPFAALEAARLEELRLVAIEEQVEAELRLGHHVGLVSRLQTLVAEHPLRERLWARLMVALYRCGRQAEALRAFQTARTILCEELGIEPGPDLRKVEADVLAQAPALDWIPTGETSDRARRNQANPASQPFLGRNEPMHHLSSVLADAVAGAGQLVLVSGEPGIGKTRLAEELAARALDASVDVAWGRCSKEDGAPAFWPWMQIVEHLIEHRDADEIRTSLGTGAAAIAQVVPAVNERYPALDPPPVLEPSAARFHVYDSLAGFLCRLSGETALVVVLDDVHWADVPTLELLSYLAGRMSAARLLVIAIYRDVDPPVGAPLADALADLARERAASRLHLAGLTREDVGRFIAAATGAPPSAEVVKQVHARTEGNPFFVSELTRLLHTTDTLPEPERYESWPTTVPGSVRDVIRRRVSALPRATNEVLVVAAVAGREVDVDVLERATDLNRAALLDALEPALNTRLLVETPDSYTPYRFSHALVNETIYEGIGTIRRARLHKRVGEALEEMHGPNEALHYAELAHHFFLAVPACNRDRAIAYALRAAEWAQARLGYEQAEEQLRKALAALASEHPGPTRDRYELQLQLRLGSLLMLTKGYGASATGEAFTKARALCERLGETSRVVRVVYGLMVYQANSARHEAARHLADTLLEIASMSSRPADLVAANQAVGVAASFRGELRLAERHLRQALEIPDGLWDPELVAWFPFHPLVGCWTFLAEVIWLLGDRERATQLSVDSVAFAAQVGHDLTMAHALDFVAWIHVLEGDPTSVRPAAERAATFAREKGFPLYVALATILCGWARAQQGEAEAGVAEIKTGLEATATTGAFMLRPVHLGLLAQAERQAGRSSEALGSVEHALRVANSTGERFWEAELHRLRSELLLELAPEQSDEAREELRTAIMVARGQGAVTLEQRAATSLRQLTAEPDL